MKDSNVTIAVVAPQEPFEYFSDFWEGAWSAAYELAPLGVQVNNILMESQNAEQQALALEDLLQTEVDAIVLLPSETKRFDALIERHVQRGTVVVTAFSDAPQSRRSVYVGPDYRVAGRLAGELFAKMLPSRSHIAALRGSRENTCLNQQYEGFHAALLGSGLPFSLTEYSDPETFLAAMIASELPFDGLYAGCSESPLLGGILELVRRPALAVAFGLTEVTKPYLESGTLCAVIDSSRYYQGYLAVQKAYECLNAYSIDAQWVPIPSSVMLAGHVTADGQRSSLQLIMETVVRQRTQQLQTYKQALDLANARLLRMGETDPATGLLNGRKFEEILEVAAAEADESGSTLALIAIAMDDANALNGILGPAALEQAIQSLADALREECGAGAILARTGPDRLAVLLPATPVAAAQALEDRIAGGLNQARMAAHPDLSFSVSTGLAWTPTHGRTGRELRGAAEGQLMMSGIGGEDGGGAAGWALRKVG